MSTIRRQSIISSAVIYIGFAVGMLNIYFFTQEGLFTKGFTEEQYGLTSIFIAISSLMASFAMLAMPSYIFKFYHYYNDHLPIRKNDMVTWALLISSIGFVLVMIAGWFFKDLVIRKFGQHSPMLLVYYYWIFPMGLGLTIYTVLEAYAWGMGKAVLTSFLREVQWRLWTTVLVLLWVMGVITDYSLFIKLFAFGYPLIAITLFIYLVAKGKIHFTFRVSKVSRRYWGKILRFCTFFYAGAVIFTLSTVFDTIVIASRLDDGTAKAGIFGLAAIMASIIQAPQRAIIAASMTHLSKAWKDKNMKLLQRVYQRSSINLLVFALGIYILIGLNYREAVITLQMKDSYLAGFNAFLLLGFVRVIDMGTGVNGQIIGTSTYWKFELISGVILLAFMLPLTYILTNEYDIMGPAIASLISISIYNAVRIAFLWSKFKLFPFSKQSLYTVLLAGASFTICYLAFRNLHGFPGLIVRSLAFIIIYAGATVYLKLSPDIEPVVKTIRKRLGLKY
jgi:O-antigen/teichoic acid export membrane protein